MPEQFISAAIQPVKGSFDAARMSAGEPGLPREFRWKQETIRIQQVLKTWRETGPCHHGSGESYVRKHWFEVLTEGGDTMTIYFERQARSGKIRSRWWLFTIGSILSSAVATDRSQTTASAEGPCRQATAP